MNKKAMGARLARARKAAGYTSAKAAVDAMRGDDVIGWRIIYHHEAGEMAPGAETLYALCKLYGVSADHILNLPTR